MKIGIVVGSHRKESESAKVGAYLASVLEEMGHSPWTLDLGKSPLPMWDEALFSGEGKWSVMADLTEELHASDGFVIVSPEWHGMATSGLKNFFMLCSSTSGLGHKPALITSVSAVDGGAYVVAELRTSSYKNNRLCYIPENLIVRNVGSVLNADASLNDAEAHPYFVDRAAYCLNLLVAYGNAMRQVREGGWVDHETYPNGM